MLVMHHVPPATTASTTARRIDVGVTHFAVYKKALVGEEVLASKVHTIGETPESVLNNSFAPHSH